MKKYLIMALALGGLLAPATVCAQNPGQSFRDFRQGLLNDYAGFRSRILEHYADFLNGEWHEYEPLNPEEHYSKPKPAAVPSVNPEVEPPRTAAPVTPVATAMPAPQPVPGQQPARPQPEASQESGNEHFSFYGIPVELPEVEFNVKNRLLTTGDYASQWQSLASQSVASALVDPLKRVAREAGLNDYLTYRLVNAYVSRRLENAHETSRMSLTHYLLANMGYDVRIALTDTGTPMLLLPTKQKIYGRVGMLIGKEKYYLFLPDGHENDNLSGHKVLTCMMPAEASSGNKFDLRLGQLNIPMQPHSFSVSDGAITLTGQVNRNLIDMLYLYPQIPMDEYAKANLDPQLRESLVEQLRSQLSGKSSSESVEALLHFTQHAFDYATDQENHGFEKPYFLEETLFYPRNDCEDRAIFYTYFLWNALGLNAQLVSFPGHEAATVKLDQPIKGICYNIDGEDFYISDPTFVGASSGMVMPEYRGVTPEIDYTYR